MLFPCNYRSFPRSSSLCGIILPSFLLSKPGPWKLSLTPLHPNHHQPQLISTSSPSLLYTFFNFLKTYPSFQSLLIEIPLKSHKETNGPLFWLCIRITFFTFQLPCHTSEKAGQSVQGYGSGLSNFKISSGGSNMLPMWRPTMLDSGEMLDPLAPELRVTEEIDFWGCVSNHCLAATSSFEHLQPSSKHPLSFFKKLTMFYFYFIKFQ